MMAATREDDRELDVLERGAAHGHEPVDVVESLNDGPFSQPQLKATTHLTTGAEDNVVVEMNNVHKTYLLGLEGVPALRGVTMTIARGEFVCIFGTSGGGKTSMLNIIGTIDKPTKGDLRLCGTRITARTPDRVLAHIRLHQLGFVFQTFNLLSALTALENVEMPMILAGKLSRAQRRARAKQLLERVGMGARTGHLPSQLSGGEQQRVTIARALANEPSVLLLDEPTGDLDSKNTALVMRLLLELNREGITLIMVTHDMALKWFSDRVIWMRDGKIQRVEIVNEEKRLEVRAELAEECRALDAAAAAKASAPVGTPARAAAGGASLSNTKLRQPRDYKTYHPGGSAPPELLVHSITTANASHVPPPPRSPAAAASGAVSSDEDRSF